MPTNLNRKENVMLVYSTFTCPETGLYAFRIRKFMTVVYESSYRYSSGRQARLAAVKWIEEFKHTHS